MGLETKAMPRPAKAPDCAATVDAMQKEKMNPITENTAQTVRKEEHGHT